MFELKFTYSFSVKAVKIHFLNFKLKFWCKFNNTEVLLFAAESIINVNTYKRWEIKDQTKFRKSNTKKYRILNQ